MTLRQHKCEISVINVNGEGTDGTDPLSRRQGVHATTARHAGHSQLFVLHEIPAVAVSLLGAGRPYVT